MLNKLLVFVSLLIVQIVSAHKIYVQPEQIHINYGATPDIMVITWVTMDPINETVVEYGVDKLSMVQTGTADLYVDGGYERRKIMMHRVILTNLVPGQTYRYHVGSPSYGWSPLFYFRAMRNDPDWQPSFAVFGDMGNVNAQSIPRLQEETMLGIYDAILHVGDFAYDLHTDNARVGDAFMNQIEPIAAYLPYMTCPGNHEWMYNFSNYKYRFSMPNKDNVSQVGGDNNHFYSINIGPVHLISFSTEFYYFIQYGFMQMSRQYDWLVNDLKQANLPENRAKQPWIITMAHRPMYCTNDDMDDCTKFDDRVRTGFPFLKLFGLEDIFYNYGVDVELWAHEHSYERLWPIYNYTVLNGTEEEPYTNPGAPVHIVTGSAGCQENHDNFGPATDFTAFRSTDYGYTRMKVFNSTHLYMEQVSDEKDGDIIDSLWLIKDSHGPYKKRN